MNQRRWERVRAHMREMGLPAILVSAPASVEYLTGLRVAPGERMLALWMDAEGEGRLFVNRLFALSRGELPVTEFDDTDDCVQVLAQHLRAGTLGIDKTWQSQFALRLMAIRPDIALVLGSEPVDRARMLKDEDELRRLRASSLANDRAVRATIAGLREGMTELEAAQLYVRAQREAGGAGASFEPLVCFGKNAAEPHHASDETMLRSGDAVILDLGLVLAGAVSDMTRTVVWGRAGGEFLRVYELVLRANAAGRAAVRPGVPLREIDRATRAVIEAGGYGAYFIHRTGHGVGIEVHEPPDVSASSPEIARPGMVFSIEPGIYLPGKFGVRIEDLVAVTEDGAQTLNELPRELIEL